jgi:hypothetical protein
MGKVQQPSNSECYTPSSEPFRIYVQDQCIFSDIATKSNVVSCFVFGMSWVEVLIRRPALLSEVFRGFLSSFRRIPYIHTYILTYKGRQKDEILETLFCIQVGLK